MDPSAYQQFSGMDTRLPDHQLVKVTRDRARVLIPRELRNLLVTDQGGLTGRAGFTQHIAGTEIHSLWSDGHEKAFFVESGTLKAFTGASLYTGVVREVSYAELGTDVYWSDGAYLGCIHQGANHLAAQPAPNPAPTVTPAAGVLPLGVYQIAITLLDTRGVESPATWPESVELLAPGGLAITNLPSGRIANIYMAPAGATQLQLVGPAINSVTINTLPQLGHTLQTDGLAPMPAGRIVRSFNGRLLVASGSALYFSEPFAPALYRPTEGFIPFPDRVTMVRPNDEGVYVGTTQATYWLAGADIAKSEVMPVSTIGVADGSDSVVDPDAGVVQWFAHDGLVRADRSGKTTTMQRETAPAAKADRATTVFVDAGHTRHSVASSFVNSSAVTAGSFMDAEIA